MVTNKSFFFASRWRAARFQEKYVAYHAGDNVIIQPNDVTTNIPSVH
jgi:hypothetical protein